MSKDRSESDYQYSKDETLTNVGLPELTAGTPDAEPCDANQYTMAGSFAVSSSTSIDANSESQKLRELERLIRLNKIIAGVLIGTTALLVCLAIYLYGACQGLERSGAKDFLGKYRVIEESLSDPDIDPWERFHFAAVELHQEHSLKNKYYRNVELAEANQRAVVLLEQMAMREAKLHGNSACKRAGSLGWIAHSFERLGTVKSGCNEVAKKYRSEALHIEMQAHGREHRHVVHSLMSLGYFPGSKRYFEEALRIVLETESPVSKDARDLIAMLDREPEQEVVQKIRKQKETGELSVDDKASGEDAEFEGNRDKAVECYKAELIDLRRKYGAESLQVLYIEDRLVRLLYRLHREAEATPLETEVKRLRKIWKKRLPEIPVNLLSNTSHILRSPDREPLPFLAKFS